MNTSLFSMFLSRNRKLDSYYIDYLDLFYIKRWRNIMDALNFKHLRYFWMVAKTGSIARAADPVSYTHLTLPTIYSV